MGLNERLLWNPQVFASKVQELYPIHYISQKSTAVMIHQKQYHQDILRQVHHVGPLALLEIGWFVGGFPWTACLAVWAWSRA